MIKISHSDTLVDIIEKVQKNPEKDVFLDFPAGHNILHNYISLKILKTKLEGKDITIATNDIIAAKIGKKLGLKYSLIKDKEYIEKKNSASENIMLHNFGFLEYLTFEISRYYKSLINIIGNNKKINSLTYYKVKYNKSSGVGFFFICLIISIFILTFIFYFAINKTNITITPEISVKSTVKNFTFKENEENVLLKDDKYIKIESLETALSIQESFIPTEIDAITASKSSGKIQIINTLKEEINLVPGTRFMTSSGVLFETKKWIILPPSTPNKLGENINGESEVIVTAKDYDIHNSYIGEIGNIKKSERLSLPGLTGENSNSVYAISLEDFTGGKKDFKKKVGVDDLENAKKILEQKLKNDVTRELSKVVQEKNKKNGTQYGILGINEIIQYSNIKIEIVGDVKVGSIIDSYTLKGSIIGKTYIYDTKEVANKLKTIVKETILEGVESILLIDEDSLKITEVLSRKENPFEVKATVEIDTFISHDFLSKNNNYTEKLKDSIRGLSKEDAAKLLINDSKISNVVIEIRPFFLRNISNISENIIFELKDS